MADKRQAEHERVGSIAGLGAGVIAGAQVGTIFIPIPIVGTFAGALVGGKTRAPRESDSRRQNSWR